MDWAIASDERAYLRQLAQKQAEIAALPVMEKRKKQWYALNDNQPGTRPPVIIEPWTFDRDFLPDSVFRCQSETGRNIERQLLRNIRNHELIDDDKVMPDAFTIGWFVEIDEFGVKIEYETVPDAQGIKTGYHWTTPLADLKENLHRLRPAVCQVDRQRTGQWQAFLEELFDGILLVRLKTGAFGSTMLTNRVVALMGMEAYFMAMYDAPDELHQLMAFLRDNALRVMRWAESEKLLRLNNENHDSFGSSSNFTTALPAAGYSGTARLCDMFGCANSQETVGLSPSMFHDFCFPYYRDVCKPLGLVYYGCCEPVHPFWDDISQLPHLKKVSISRWCDEKKVGEMLKGTNIIFSRKPDPRFLGIDQTLDESGWIEHIRQSLEATPGVGVEFIVRDVYTVHGNLKKVHRAVELARQEIDRCGRG